MSVLLRLLSLLCMCLLFHACIDTISFTRDDNAINGIVIQGKLIKSSKNVIEVHTERLFTQTGFVSPRKVEVRSVDLIDEDGNELQVRKRANGYYRIEIPEDDPNFKVEHGRSYRIRVVSLTGGVYESELDQLTPVPKIDALTFSTFEREEELNGNVNVNPWLSYNLSTSLRPEGSDQNANLNYEFSHVWEVTTLGLRWTVPVCWIKSNLGTSNPFNLAGGEINSDYIENYPILQREINFNYAEGNYLTVVQESVTDDTQEYLDRLRQLVNRGGSMFEPTSGNLQGNIQQTDGPPETIYGYFYATSHDTARLYIAPEEVGNPVPFCSSFDGQRQYYPRLCEDCIRYEPAASETSPWYWVR